MGSATNVGVGIGLLISVLIVAVLSVGPELTGKPSRPEGVPADAQWLDNAFGQPGWVRCAQGDKGIQCQAFAVRGFEVLNGTYVPRGNSAPAPPIENIVVRDVEAIWLNKVAMVPDGQISFPHAGLNVRYDQGQRRTQPGP